MKKLLLVLFAASSPILVLEAIGWQWERALTKGPHAWELVASRRLQLVKFEEPDAGYTLMKPGTRYEWLGVQVAVNSQGIRDNEISLERIGGLRRILNLGDSVAMGWAVRATETYGKRLETYLAAAGRAHQVINAAVPGWNLENAAAFYRAQGKTYKPDLIILEVTIVNDIYGENALVAHKRPLVIEWLRANTHFWPFLTTVVRDTQEAFGQQAPNVLNAPRDAASYFPEDCTSERYDRVWAAVVDLREQAHSAGADLLLLLIPLELQVTDETFSRAAQNCLAQKAANSGIHLLDMYPAYRAACLSGPSGPCTNGDHYLFADTWMHPSALGHDLIAQELARIL